jgi:proline iminopeptidase
MTSPLSRPFEIRDLSAAPESERQAVVDQIRAGLVAYNLSQQPHTTSEPILLAVFQGDTLLGGLAGRVTWDWLRIELLWIAEVARGGGVGRELMRLAEKRAREARCIGAHTDTFSFQALDFYLAAGYEIFGELDDYPPEEKHYFLRKLLLANSEPLSQEALVQKDDPFPEDYLDNAGRDDVLSGGVTMIPIETAKGTFRVWTKRLGNNPRVKVLTLHGGPGATHEYLEAFDSYCPAAGFEYYHYDQLGSYYSDQPDEPELVELPRFVEEVEQVRQSLGLNRDNFYLYGHSWGGILAIEYALKYQQHLKALIISNMVASIPMYNEYAREVLMPGMDQDALAEIAAFEEAGNTENPRYMELLIEHHYVHHVLRMPVEEWPDPVNRTFKHINNDIYVPMQGPSELGASGKLLNWDRTADLAQISVPTLTIGARYDTMDPEHMEWMAGAVQNGRYLHCPNGSHLAMYDDQQVFFQGLIKFVRDVDAGRFSG